MKESVEKRASLRARFHARGYAAARLCSCEQAHRNESISYLPMNLAKTYFQLLLLMYVSVRNIKSVAPPTVRLFNPSESQLGKEDTGTASLTAQRALPSKGSEGLVEHVVFPIIDTHRGK